MTRNLISTLRNFSLLFIGILLLGACSQESPLTPEPPSLAALIGDGGTTHNPGGPLIIVPDPIPFTMNWQVQSAALFPGYDLAIQVFPTGINHTNPPRGWACGPATYSLTFNFPRSAVISGVTTGMSSNSTRTPLSEYQSGGTPAYSSASQHSISLHPTRGMVILLKLVNGLPSGITAQTAVARAGGICIVDDVATPTGPDPDQTTEIPHLP